MSTGKTLLVLGGGVGGVIAARELRKRLPRQHRVVLIEREEHHVFAPSLLWLLVGDRRPEELRRPLAHLSARGIEVLRGEITAIDPARRAVRVGDEELVGDHVIVSLGAELAPELVPGLAEAGHGFYTTPGAESLRDAVATLERGRVVVLTAAPAYKCPAAPYEAALLLEAKLRKRGVRAQIEIEVHAAEPAPMGVAGPEMSAAVRGLLAAKGIAYHPGRQVESADAAARTLTFTGGESTQFDVLAYVPPHRAPRVIRESALAGPSGWVAVDRHTLETPFPGVYALGDVVSIPLALGKPLPKAGVFAHGQAEVVARNVAAVVLGHEPADRFGGHGECFIEIGDGKAGFGAGNFYAEPTPEVKLHAPSWRWHVGKVLFEKTWLAFKA
ncbi:MAG: NAD(P)/FAD-dependent oxidoreductase [Polyangiaceae bacterium]|nr:NAD(P)/FAD-dependent oxidoreductase [Polyangiaceae bacterium]